MTTPQLAAEYTNRDVHHPCMTYMTMTLSHSTKKCVHNQKSHLLMHMKTIAMNSHPYMIPISDY